MPALLSVSKVSIIRKGIRISIHTNEGVYEFSGHVNYPDRSVMWKDGKDVNGAKFLEVWQALQAFERRTDLVQGKTKKR